MDTIGVNVNTMIANARTDALLEQSQRLTAELQARQQELQRSNAELADKAGELDLASRYKSQFLANMSHELRTPLNSLLVLARLLAQNLEGNLTAKQVEYATIIHSSGSDLLRLINDILDLTKVEAGKMEITPERFALAGLVEDLRGVFGPLTEEKRLRFMITTAPGVPAVLETDKQRLRQILYNLLSNAVKFTDHGRVELHIDTAGPGQAGADTGSWVVFSVTDTGIGIGRDNLGSIFSPFQQADGTTSRRYGGTGLGLAICSFIVTGTAWKLFLDPRIGLEKAVHDLGWTSFHFDWVVNPRMMIYCVAIAGVWQTSGFVMAMFLAALRGIDSEILKAAQIDGASAYATYRRIIIPIMRPVFMSALIILTHMAIKSYDLVLSVTGKNPGGAAELPSTFMYSYTFTRNQMAVGSASAVIMMMTIAAIMIPYLYSELREKR